MRSQHASTNFGSDDLVLLQLHYCLRPSLSALLRAVCFRSTFCITLPWPPHTTIVFFLYKVWIGGPLVASVTLRALLKTFFKLYLSALRDEFCCIMVAPVRSGANKTNFFYNTN
jgi:hypothetical protein